MIAAGRKCACAAALASLIAVMAPSGPASAQAPTREEVEALREELELLRGRVRELEERLGDAAAPAAPAAPAAVAPPPPVAPRRGSITVELGGQVSSGVLFADNGEDSQFFVVDNDNASSRLGLLARAVRVPWTAGTYFEFGAEPNSTDDISFDQEGAALGDEFSVRHAELFFEHVRYGAVAIGKGDAATNEVAEIDLSGTDVILESDVDDLAGGLDFHLADDIEGFDEGLEVDDVFSNLDGEREVRVAYESPELAGLSLRASLREDDDGLSPGASLAYEAERAGYALLAGIGWRREYDDDFPGNSDVFLGSASTVLAPFGVALSVAGGVEVFDEDNFEEADGIEDNSFVYAKATYIQQFFVFGETSFAVDYFKGKNHGGDERFLVGAVLRTVGAESVGGAVVQDVDPLSSELFLGMRNYSIELPARSAVVRAGADAEPDDLVSVLLGARVRF